jgi:hypothetical protein
LDTSAALNPVPANSPLPDVPPPAATIPVPAEDHTPAHRSCLNCGAPLTGRYCSNCSQPADVHVPSTVEIIHEALEGLTHSDSRLWRTLYLLWLKPGRLTQEFISGRRVAYLPPFRLYLVLSVIFFLIASVSHPYGHLAQWDDSDLKGRSRDAACSDLNINIGAADWTPRLRHACTVVVSDNGASLMHAAIGTMPKAMFIFLPLVAFLHMLMYWRPRHKYAEHLLFFLHLHAFFFSVMTLVLLLTAAAEAWPRLDPLNGYGSLVFWSLAVYTVLAMRRVFGQGWAATVFKGLALFFVYMIVLSITFAGVIFYAALQL